jgi:CRP-like cAMP-binding protein
MRYYSKIIRKYKTGDMIFAENSECDGMYIIDSGRVRVYKTVGIGAQAREVDLCVLGPNAMFGEMAMIDEHRRSASVQAIELTTCTVITKKIFEDQLQRIPPWMVNMIRILVSRLRETNNKLREIIEQYTTAPQDSGTMLTVDSSEAQKAMAGSGRPDGVGLQKGKNTVRQGKERDKGREKEAGRHFRSDEILDALGDEDDK